MSRAPRRNVPSTTSTLTKTQRVLIITLASVLAVGGVAVSQSAALRERLSLSARSKPAPAQQLPSPAAAPNHVDLLRMAGVKRAPGPLFSVTSPVAPTVSATKTDSLFTDVDGDNQADPGDTLKYTVTISASGADATGVTFTDTVDPNTAFVAGSLRATPVAVNDTYAATGNVRISVAAPGVLGNDFTGLPSATITAPPSTSTNGGDVTLNADGSFTYNPPAGFEGADTFTYTLTNSEGSNPATVTINVSGMIWFINNNATACTTLAGGCGRLTNPFSSLSAFAGLNNGSGNNPAANDNIFLYESATDYVGPVTLLNGQRFIGQDATASLSTITGLTPPAGSDPLPATNSGNATIVNITSASTGITVASGNTLRGFTGGNAATDISGTSFGTLTISDVTLNGTGEALNLTTGTLAATFGSISSNNSTATGVSLAGVAGSLTTPTTTVTNPAGIGISVGTSSATLNFGTTASTGSGGTGVSLLTNTGTITFGTLTITPDANQRGLLATNNSNTITSTSGAITTSGAIAVEITRSSGTTPLAISQTSVSASGGANGIKLTNTSGSFTVTGDGGVTNDGSGGTISGATAEGILMNVASNVSLGYMNITNSGTDGINTTAVNGFTLNRSNISDSAGGASDDGIAIINTSGTVTVDNCSITNSPHNGFTVDNNNTNMAGFNLTNTTISCAAGQPCQPSGSIGNDGLSLSMRGTSVLPSGLVSGSTFSGVRAVGVQIQTNDTGRIGTNSGGSITASIIVQSNTFTSNGQGIDIDSAQVSNLTFEALTNTINGISTAGGGNGSATAINAFTSAGADTGPASHSFVGKIDGNIIGTQGTKDSGSGFGNGIRVVVQGQNTQGNITVSNNTVRECAIANPMNFIGQNGAATSGTNTARFKIINNTLPLPSGTNVDVCGSNTPCIDAAVFILADEGTPVCNVITGNNVFDATAMNGAADIYLAERAGPPAGAQLTVEGTGGSNSTYIQANNTLAGSSPFLDEGSNTSQVALGACGTFPSLPQTLNENALTDTSNGPATQTIERSSTQTEDILMAGGLEKPVEERVTSLNRGALAWMVQAALARWEQAGISAEDLMRLRQVTFEVADLPGQQLATATSTSVQIDETAAGYGWYSDMSPMEDSEFDVAVPGKELQTTEFSPAFGRMDLLTVVLRELGTVYLQGKQAPKQLTPLMEGTLSPAVRRLPDSRNIQLPRSPAKQVANRTGSEKSLVSQISNRSALRPKTGVSTSPVSIRNAAFRNAAFSPGASRANSQSSRLMNHASRKWTTAASLSSMLADVNLSIGTLPAGKSATITFRVTVDNPFTGATAQVSNQGTVSGTNFSNVLTDDPDVGGTADPTVTPIQLQADLAVTKADSPDPVIAGNNITYTVNFANNGPNTSGATVTDATPAGTTFVSASVTTGTGWGVVNPSVGGTGNIVFSKASVANGETAVFSVVVKVGSNVPSGTIINNSAVAATTGGPTDPVPANNTGTATTNVIAQADLSITKTDGVTTKVPGTSVSYTITVNNSGPSDANGATVADTFPGILTGVTYTSVAAGGATGNTAAGAGNINDTVNMPAGSSVTYTVSATVASSATGSLSNTATVTAPGGVTDPTPGNNSATDTDTLTPQADLSITKTDGATTEVPGTSVTYTIVATNNGPSDANGVTVADTFPGILSGVTYTSVAAGGATGNTAAGSGNINNTVNMPTGSSITYTVSANIASSATGSLSNTATVTAPGGVTDPTPGNNSATDTDTLTPSADVSVTKTDSPDPVIAGNNITYTITVTNSGPSDAQSLSLSDAVPANTTLVSVTTPAGWTRTDAVPAGGTGTLTFTRPSLAAGVSSIFTVVVNVNAGTLNGTTITNTANVASATADPTSGNNSAVAMTLVQNQADLAISKTRTPLGTITAGTNVTYTIVVTNNGPAPASNVTFTDVVPTGTSLVSQSSPGGWTCNTVPVGGTGTITCTKGTMANGETATLTVVATVNCDVPNGTTINNTATVSALSPSDNNTGNNTSTASFVVNNPAPVVTASVTTSQLPQNSHDLINVGLAAVASDGNCPTPTNFTVQVFGDEDDQTPTANNEVFSPDAKNIAVGTLRLRGERVSSGDGRVYLIVVRTTDAAGGTGFATVTVVVPKSSSSQNVNSVNAQAAAAKAYADANNGAPPPGYFVIGDGPIIGNKQ